MSITQDIVRAHTRPRQVMARLLGMGQREDRVLAMLMGACLLFFVMQWPGLARQAEVTGDEFSKLIAYAFFGAMFVLPLIMYALAGVLHLFAKVFRGQGTWYTARLTLFWSLLASAPMALLWGLMRGLNDNPDGATVLGYVGGAVFIWVFLNSLFETEWA